MAITKNGKRRGRPPKSGAVSTGVSASEKQSLANKNPERAEPGAPTRPPGAAAAPPAAVKLARPARLKPNPILPIDAGAPHNAVLELTIAGLDYDALADAIAQKLIANMRTKQVIFDFGTERQ